MQNGDMYGQGCFGFKAAMADADFREPRLELWSGAEHSCKPDLHLGQVATGLRKSEEKCLGCMISRFPQNRGTPKSSIVIFHYEPINIH